MIRAGGSGRYVITDPFGHHDRSGSMICAVAAVVGPLGGTGAYGSGAVIAECGGPCAPYTAWAPYRA
ncbi:hypothetical protein GCM10027176_54610 [Actinoallomurus bryophytorum]